MTKQSSQFFECVNGFYENLANNPKIAHKHFHEQAAFWSIRGEGLPTLEFDSFSKIKSRLESFEPYGNVTDVGRKITFYNVSINPKSINHINVHAHYKILWHGFGNTESLDEMVVIYDQGYKIKSIKSAVRLSTPSDVAPTFPFFFFATSIMEYFNDQEKQQNDTSNKIEKSAGCSSYQE